MIVLTSNFAHINIGTLIAIEFEIEMVTKKILAYKKK